MLRYIVIAIIKTLMPVLAFVIIFATPLKSKTIFASYEISWNALILGNLYWEFILNSKKKNKKIIGIGETGLDFY